MMHLVAEVRVSTLAHPPSKELFLIIPMHMMSRELIPGRQEGSTLSCINCDRCWCLG